VNGPDPSTSEIAAAKDRLQKVCLESLPRLYLEEAGILAKGVSWNGETYEVLKPSVLDTANVLLALYTLRSRGIEAPLDADRLLTQCVGDYLEHCDFAETVLLVWADSLGDRKHSERLWPLLQERLPRHSSNTMLLSWALSGVCEHFKAGGDRESTESLARNLYDTIAGNQFRRTGLFFSSNDREGFLRKRRPLSHLPSQVFAIQALAEYSLTFSDKRAADLALRCADRLCALQGPQGQWWCVYNVREGTVAEKYPVYSVHQDGAMPTALNLVGRARQDHRLEEAGTRGLMWVFGNNELQTSLVDDKQKLVLRGIRQDDGKLAIIREMRSYHPGRCLHALASAGSG